MPANERQKQFTYFESQMAECSLAPFCLCIICTLTSQYHLQRAMWLEQYSPLHPLCDILGCGSIVFIVVKELPLPKGQQSKSIIS